MRNLIRMGILVAVVAVGTARTYGQNPYSNRPSVTNQPAVSPYLNLLRRGTSPGVNYYGLVKPDLEFRNAYRGLQQAADNQQLGGNVDRQTGLPETGHGTVFLDTKGYFLTASPAQSSRRTAGGVAAGGVQSGGQQQGPSGRRR